MRTALKWFKSSYSGSDGGDCVEVAYDWRKSSYSADQGNCVEVARDADTAATATIHIRDSKNATGPLVSVNPAAWAAFTRRGSW
ncbi:DUF397 domain-containing protein [Streptomyces sp. DW26H14]|uniref:DUF397 domain-containing protein n=1 Tax=Streptomyces sp. DW26H14 TaxID=3435395 RepID=UPI00403DFF83